VSRARFDVAFPLVGFNPSGGVRMLVHVANALVQRGRSVCISVPPHAATAPIPLDPRITLLTRRDGTGLNARLAFARELPNGRVSVASGYQTPALIALGQAVTGLRPHIVYLIQNDEPASHIEQGNRPAALKALLHLVAQAGYRVPATRIAVSTYVAERVGRERIARVISPGIDERFFSPPPGLPRNGRVSVGVLAHPGAVKGLDVALDAFARLAERRDVRPILFDGAHKADAPASVERFSALAQRTGVAHDIAAFYASCDVFVFPSRVEGFGLPPLEAMACGAAVVVTDCGGPRDYARDNQNCVVVPVGNAAALAGAITRLADDATLRARLAGAGAETARRYPVHAFASACADEIERVLARP